VPLDARLEFLLRDYAYLGEDREALVAQLDKLRGLQSNETIERWLGWARQAELPALFSELMTLHYDPLYSRSQPGYLRGWAQAQTVELQQLDEDALQAGAARLLRPHSQ
jgi:tRNA 2-selenouridine synthase